MYEKGFNDGVDSLESFYIEAHRSFGFDDEKCLQLLNAMNDIVTNHFTSQDIIHDAWEEVGLKIVMHDGIEPFQKIHEEET